MANAHPFLIQAENLSVSGSSGPILDEISLTLNANEIVTLIGPNGAGKTTLLQALIGLIRPTGGLITRSPDLRLGYVPQRRDSNPYLPITVADFLTHEDQPADPEWKAATIHDTGIEPILARSLHTLSGGEWQRLLLARAVLRKPDLLILDEPMQGVDLQGQLHLYAYLEEIRKRLGLGILMVSHDLHFVMAGTSRVICLNRHICCEGAPDHVRQHKAFRELFGAQAERWLAHYTHHHDHTHDWPTKNHPESCNHDH